MLLIDQHMVAEQAKEQAERVLSEAARRQTDMLNVMLDSQYEMLRAVAANTNAYGKGFTLEAEPLQLFSDASVFSFVCLADQDGMAYYPDGSRRLVADRFYYARAKAGYEAIQKLEAGRSDGKPRFVLAVPFQYGDKSGAVFGALEVASFEALVQSGAYSSNCLTYVADATGGVCLWPVNDGFTDQSVNLFQIFDNAQFEGGYSAEQLRLELSQGGSGTFLYEIPGVRAPRYVSFQALELEPRAEHPWYVFNEIPESSINALVQTMRQTNVRNIIVVMLAGVFAALALLLRERNSRKLILADAERLRASEETSRIALEMTDKIISRYDICSKTWRSQSAYVSRLKAAPVMENMPESMIEAGVIANESKEDYRAFFRDMEAGVPRGRCVVRILCEDGSTYWEQNDYVTIFDTNQKPVSAVISSEDVTLRRQMELAYEKWRQTVDKLPKDQAALFEHNLTLDICCAASGGLLPPFPAGGYAGINERVSFISRRFVAPEDAERFCQFVKRDRLLAEFAEGKTEQTLLFRRGRHQQRERLWTRLSIQMVRHSDSNEIMAYVLFEDVDDLKREELLLQTRSERDALTGVYDRAAFQKRVEAMFRESGAGEQHAVLMIDVDDFKRVNDNRGHDVGDQVLIDMAETLHAAMRAGDLVGRLGGDEFMVCFRDVPGETLAAKRAQELCRKLNINLGKGLTISCSIGVVMYPGDGTTFEELYKKADDAMYRAKRRGKNGFAFHRDIG